MRSGGRQGKTRDNPTGDPIEQLFTVFDGKPFQNLSWRLLRLLVDGVTVDRRVLGKGDTLAISKDIDVIYVESGQFEFVGPESKREEPKTEVEKKAWFFPPLSLDAARVFGTWKPATQNAAQPLYRNTASVLAGTQYKATAPAVVHVFFKDPNDKKSKAGPKKGRMSRWSWLCRRSLVARTALQSSAAPMAEVVMLTSLDLVEYLPALTDLLAQTMTRGDLPDDEDGHQFISERGPFADYPTPAKPKLRVCLVRLDDAAYKEKLLQNELDENLDIIPKTGKPYEYTKPASWSPWTSQAVQPLDVILTSTKTIVECVTRLRKRNEKGDGADKRATYHYIFVDPYDRASDLSARQVKSFHSRARVSEQGAGVKVNPNSPGSTLSAQIFEELTEKVDSVVHVSRDFRVHQRKDDPDKLNFHAVVLDSRTARFEPMGIQDRSQLRSADDPLRSPVDVPEAYDDAPTTRLHFNLLRLKKAWEQSPAFDDVCEALDEPNIPHTGRQQGYWQAKGFFERWVRDLRFRRVGLALGGGGATGFAHVALLRELRQRKIPIDLVSGTSFGALVGAYYCANGLDGVEMLVEQGLLYTGVVSLTVVTSAVLEHLVNLSIEYRPMWELPIPFYAVATDIQKGEQAVFPGPLAENPSVGFAVRASGALPGFFAPALAGDQRPVRYVDGGAVSIVPARCLLRLGADVIIGSNAFPFRKNDATYNPTPLAGLFPPPFNRMAEQALAQLNPGNRMTDAARTLALTLTDAMVRETTIASALYEHKRTGVKYWEFHRARRVIQEATEDLQTSAALPAAINAVRLLNLP